MQGNFLRISPRFIFLVSFYLMSLAPMSALAGANNNDAWFMGLGGGAAWEHIGNSTSVANGLPYPPPADRDYFSINNVVNNAVLQFDVGYRWIDLTRQYFPYMSAYLQYRSYINNNITGTVEQFYLPEFTNYHYEMAYAADLLTLNGKFNVADYKRFMPYFAVGAGYAFNTVYDYSEQATSNVTPRENPGYGLHRSTHIAVTLGVGVDYRINDSSWVTLGYDHVFQGSIRSGAGQGSWSGTSLDFGQIKMDTVFIHYTINFPK